LPGCGSPRKDATSQVGAAGIAVPWLEFEAVTSIKINSSTKHFGRLAEARAEKATAKAQKTQLWRWFEA